MPSAQKNATVGESCVYLVLILIYSNSNYSFSFISIMF